MRRITVGIARSSLCAITSPYAQAPPPRKASAGQARRNRVVTGTITLALDARETPRKLLHARETFTVTPGALTLVYPKWLPGEHAPDGAIDDLVGLKFSAGGRRCHGAAIRLTSSRFTSTCRKASIRSTSRSTFSLRSALVGSAPHRRRPRISASTRGTRSCCTRRARAPTT